MFRPNFLLFRHSQLILIRRTLCQPQKKPNEKFYVINTKDEYKKVVYKSQIMEQYCKGMESRGEKLSWERLIQMARETLTKGRRISTEAIRRLELREKLTDFKRAQIEAFATRIGELRQKMSREQLKQLPGQAKAALTVAKQSSAWIHFQNSGRQVYARMKWAEAKSRQLWSMFLQSSYKERLVELLRWTWVNTKAGSTKIVKFIYEAYFKEPQPLKIRRKKQLNPPASA